MPCAECWALLQPLWQVRCQELRGTAAAPAPGRFEGVCPPLQRLHLTQHPADGVWCGV